MSKEEEVLERARKNLFEVLPPEASIGLSVTRAMNDIEGGIINRYDEEYDVVVIHDLMMARIGEIAGIATGGAFNLKGIIAVTETWLKKAKEGDEDALMFIRHEHRHNDYAEVHGHGLHNTDQRAVDELYAYFASFIDVYGVDALYESCNSAYGEVTWEQLVSTVIVTEYIHGAWKDETDESTKEDLIIRVATASYIIARLSQRSTGLTLDYLKNAEKLDQILALYPLENLGPIFDHYISYFSSVYPNWSTKTIEVKDHEALRQEAMKFREEYQKKHQKQEAEMEATRNEIRDELKRGMEGSEEDLEETRDEIRDTLKEGAERANQGQEDDMEATKNEIRDRLKKAMEKSDENQH